MPPVLKGKAYKTGDNIDTDVIIPARYCTSFTPEDLGPHCMEDLDKDFLKKCQPGAFIVAGRNFGCGSSRENAPIAIKGAGIAAVIAQSFARIFFRNSINIGLPIFESPEAAGDIQQEDLLEIDPNSGVIANITRNKKYKSTPYPKIMQEIIDSGGMIGFVKKRLKKAR